MDKALIDKVLTAFRKKAADADRVYYAPLAAEEFDRPESEGRRVGAFVFPDTIEKHHKFVFDCITSAVAGRTDPKRTAAMLATDMAWYYTQPVAMFSDAMAEAVDATRDDSYFASETFSRLSSAPVVVSLNGAPLEAHAQYGRPLAAIVRTSWQVDAHDRTKARLQLAIGVFCDTEFCEMLRITRPLAVANGLTFGVLREAFASPWPEGEWGLDTTIVALKRALFAVCDMPQAIEWQKTITMPKPVKTRRKGLRYFPPDKPRQIVFEMPKAPPQTRVAGDGDGKSTVRPHVRRAHWHRFRVGPRDAAKPTYKTLWIPPIIVHATEYKHE